MQIFTMIRTKKIIKYTILTAGTVGAVGAITSFKSNQYNVDSIGIIRFGRASFTVRSKFLFK